MAALSLQKNILIIKISILKFPFPVLDPGSWSLVSQIEDFHKNDIRHREQHLIQYGYFFINSQSVYYPE